mmetsp:Transcript_28247/g.39754  ORF Transcript_28247/g.39754 Transcript_28247/m.39754 type:complete len:110 (-) Transcript_28247:228-557(-)
MVAYAHRMMMKSGGGLLQQRIMQQLQKSISPTTTAGNKKSLVSTTMTTKGLQVQQPQTTTAIKMLRQMSRTALGVQGSLQVAMSTQSVCESSLPRGWDLGIEGEDDDGG